MFSGFDWDKGNLEKCQKHGVSVAEIEGLFNGQIMIQPDMTHSHTEVRFLGIGQSPEGRYILVAFTIRVAKGGERHIRPISARRMHKKEVDHFEKNHS